MELLSGKSSFEFSVILFGEFAKGKMKRHTYYQNYQMTHHYRQY